MKIILGGGGDADDLAAIARLVGEHAEPEYAETRQAGGGRSVSVSHRQRPILDVADLRSIAFGHGLLLLRSAKPIMLTLRPWTARPDAEQLRRDRTAIEDAIRAAAEHRWPAGA